MRFASRVFAASALLCAAATATTFAAVIYVNAAATGANNGSSWANAYTSLQTALGAANASDELWVAAATYKPHASDRTVSFVMENGVGIYGGFNGTETLRTQRNPKTNVTVLSGDIGTVGVSNDNSHHVVTAGATVTVSGVLDGFTISGGQADGANPNERGAGIWVNAGSPTLAQLLVTANFALAQGAGLRITSGSATLLNSRFLSNTVAFNVDTFLNGGGGVFVGGGSSVIAQNCEFRSNSISGTTTGGGGIQSSGGTVTLINSVVAQNNPNGMQVASADGSQIVNSTFNANSAYGAAFLSSNSNSIANSVFWGNSTGPLCLGAPCTGSATVTYSDIQGGGIFGTGNIDADPNFLAPPADLRLGPLSAAVDAGNNSAVPGGVTVDIAGLPRFFDDPDVPDTGAGLTPPYVDMGAYERIPITVSDPTNVVVCAGAQASFTVTATGQPTLTYQWRRNGVNLSNGGTISGVTTPTVTISATVVGDAGAYDVVVTDGFGQQLVSDDGALTVNARPTAVADGGATICSGDSVQLDGTGGVSCSWTPIAGLDNPASCTPTASPGATTTYNLVVTAANGCPSTNNSSTTVTVNITPSLPIITAPISVPVGASGASASVPNHIGATWNWTLTGGVITAGQGSRQIVFDAAPPGTTMLCTVIENAGGCFSPEAFTTIQVDFLDMPPANPFHDFVVKVARNGVTAGCGGGNYCGQNPITRAQMAVFLLKSKYGATHIPPMCSGSVFTDVPCTGGPFDNWIEELAALGITGGCQAAPPLYCPSNPVTRAQMAVFLLKTLNDSSYLPPPATGAIFADVPITHPVGAWIEDLYARAITGGCLVNPLRYCPSNANNRQQMAVFLQKTFNLP